ncbi:MAG: regulatory protein RecX [Pseudomonadota bacterium]
MKEENAISARHAAMNLLARREHSLQELRRKLGKRFDQAELEQALRGLIDDKLQSDTRFCEAYTRDRVRKGFGPAKITAELQHRGIKAGDIETAIRRVREEQGLSWEQVAEQVLMQKFGPLTSEASDEAVSLAPPSSSISVERTRELSRRLRFLESRGFARYLPAELMNHMAST